MHLCMHACTLTLPYIAGGRRCVSGGSANHGDQGAAEEHAVHGAAAGRDRGHDVVHRRERHRVPRDDPGHDR